MKSNAKRRSARSTLFVCRAAIIAAIYVVLTLLASVLNLSSGVIQIRFSEMLCILPMFTPAAIPGLAIGCLISNLLASAIWQDIVFGTLATLIGAVGTYLMRGNKYLAPLPPVAANTLIIPFVLAYGYGFEGGIPFFMLTVGIGEIISIYVFGLLLYGTLKKHRELWR